MKTLKTPFRFLLSQCLLSLVLLCGVCLIAKANPVAEIEFLDGVTLVQKGADKPKIVGVGYPIDEGDIVVTSAKSFAVLKFIDGTKMTVRENSQLVVSQYRFRNDKNKKDDSMVLNLIKGGLRTITGLIPKQSEDAARIETAAGTVGIRGTDFDIRMCDKDCQTDAEKQTISAKKWNIVASARVVRLESDLNAVSIDGHKRYVSLGGPIFPGDTVETGLSGYAVLAFRDGSKVTLQPSTRFRVDDFVYDDKNAGEGRFFVSLLKGGMRGLTGLIGKANSNHVAIQTKNTVVGVKGTEYSLADTGSVVVHQGQVSVEGSGGGAACKELANAGEIVRVSAAKNGKAAECSETKQLPKELVMESPLPSSVTIDLNALFGIQPHDDSDPGLYVYVRDGHIHIANNKGEVLDLARGEFGFSGLGDGTLLRPEILANFILKDPTPLPTDNAGSRINLNPGGQTPMQCN